MLNNYTAPFLFALAMTAAPLSAASIDLTGMGLKTGSPIATASGGVFFDDGFPILTSDDPVDPLLLDGFGGAIQFAFEGDPFFDIALIDFDDPDGLSTNQREFSITASGNDETSMLEFLLEEFSPDIGAQALLTLSFDPTEIDFTTLDPFSFFSDRANDALNPQDYYSISATLTEVNAIAPIPLPAGLPLLLGGLSILAVFRRRNTALKY